MAKTKKQPPARSKAPKLPAQTQVDPAPPPAGQPFRETIESFAIAIVLAFLIRTFAAEAFVIPTGSMANTLMGQHQDVYCVQCGERYRVSASDDQDESILKSRPNGDQSPVSDRERWAHATVAGTCPTCRDTMLFSSEGIPPVFRRDRFDVVDLGDPYGGDRILVNKYIYDFQDPERWDVVVFKYPGDANTNYIKRLVGLPHEQVRIYHGDLFISAGDADFAEPFEIERKPADKILAIRELVHDTDHDAAALFDAGWPLRWLADGDGWKTTTEKSGVRVAQRYAVEQPTPKTTWLRYQHTPPGLEDWLRTRLDRPAGEQVFADGNEFYPSPELVGDFNPYNSNVQRGALRSLDSLESAARKNGIHWVGDLILEADVKLTSDAGELLLDLVKGGRHFVCQIDIATGRATLGIEEFDNREPVEGFAPTAETSVIGPGDYRLRFAHVDEQLLLWVDGKLIEFNASTAYDYEPLFGSRKVNIPRTSETDLGDLAPAAIGAAGATLAVDRFNLSRDIYYIATNAGSASNKSALTDYPGGINYSQIRQSPDLWGYYRDRDSATFPLKANQYFVMGDNSPASQDARLWAPFGPGGEYLDGDLLTGKAIFVYWPHALYSIPGTPIPLVPNVRDMRLVR